MIESIMIQTKTGTTKLIQGQSKALETRIKVRKSFDLVTIKHPTMSFTVKCGLVANKFKLVNQRVRDILRHDFEY